MEDLKEKQEQEQVEEVKEEQPKEESPKEDVSEKEKKLDELLARMSKVLQDAEKKFDNSESNEKFKAVSEKLEKLEQHIESQKPIKFKVLEVTAEWDGSTEKERIINKNHVERKEKAVKILEEFEAAQKTGFNYNS